MPLLAKDIHDLIPWKMSVISYDKRHLADVIEVMDFKIRIT